MTETSQISSIDEFLFGKLGGHSDSNVFCTFKEQIHTYTRIQKDLSVYCSLPLNQIWFSCFDIIFRQSV